MTRIRTGRSGRLVFFLATFLVLTFAWSNAARAQSVNGRAVDPDQRAVSGAQVIVLHADSVAAKETTGRDGRFGPIQLPAGEYDIVASAPGLSAPQQHVTLQSTSKLEVDVRLAVSAVQESVLVSAAQVETPLTRATDSVTVIDRSEIESTQTATVADALRLVPGFHVAASGGLGAITSIFPRGGESDYTLVLVDGVPQNAFGGGFDAAHLDTAGVERIEVVRGPKSALYGNGAIGGLVHVITRQGGPARGQLSFEGGGYGFLRSTGSASGARGSWRWGGSFDRLVSDGDTRVFPSIGRAVSNDDYDRLVGSGSIGWSDRPTRTIRVDVHGDRDVRGYPGAYGSDPQQLYGGLDLMSRGHNTTRSVAASATFGDALVGRHRLQFGWFDAKGHFVSPPYGCNPTTCQLPLLPYDNRTRRISGRYQFDLERSRGGVSAGWEVLRERNDDTYITDALARQIPVTRVVSGLFVEGRPSLGRRVLVTAGARLERIERSALESDGFSRPAFADDVVWSLNPKISAAWFARGAGTTNWTKLRASAGTGIKPPTGFDIAFTDNPNLKPERSRSVDAGVEQAFGSSLVADATWFLNRYDDLIVAIGSSMTGASRYRTDNIANARSRGLEVGAQWRTRSGFAARAAWTWLDSEVLGADGAPTAAPPPYAVGDALVRRPRHRAFGEVTWTRSRANVFATVGGRGRVSDYEPNFASSLVVNPAYATVAFGGSVRIARGFEVFGRVTNAFDRAYEEVFGFPALGRTASVGIRVAAGR